MFVVCCVLCVLFGVLCVVRGSLLGLCCSLCVVWRSLFSGCGLQFVVTVRVV